MSWIHLPRDQWHLEWDEWADHGPDPDDDREDADLPEWDTPGTPVNPDYEPEPMSVREYIARSKADEPGYDAYLGEADGKHWFLDPVQGVEWAWEDQPAGWPH